MKETTDIARYESTWRDLLAQLEDAVYDLDTADYHSGEAWLRSWLVADADGIGVSVEEVTVNGTLVPYLSIDAAGCTDLGLIAYVAQALHNLGGYDHFLELAEMEYAYKAEAHRKESEMAWRHEDHLMRSVS